MARILALDFGSARCGVAISDPSGTIASPLPVVRKAATPSGVKRIARLVEERGVERVVLGLPIGLSGRETSQTKETRQFCETLRAAVAVPVDLYDERFTTRMAERDFDPRADEDSRAAAHLLAGWLSEHVAPPALAEPLRPDTWEDDER
ncbi:MAG: Holliday junction resolvase RuvX [Solirubrobacteraceae bacterium]|nr:Holliday junction resolvase RuvX [Solirubrobacteraceae bacterium]